MFLVLQYNNFHYNHIKIGKKTNNNVMKNSDFYNITFSNSMVVLNKLFLHFPLTILNSQNYFNKIKINFNPNKNIDFIKHLVNIEEIICNKFIKESNIKNITPIYNIKNLLTTNTIKCFKINEQRKLNKTQIFIKISGIWCDSKNFGLIYKFLI
jgi:hypothetical protein